MLILKSQISSQIFSSLSSNLNLSSEYIWQSKQMKLTSCGTFYEGCFPCDSSHIEIVCKGERFIASMGRGTFE